MCVAVTHDARRWIPAKRSSSSRVTTNDAPVTASRAAASALGTVRSDITNSPAAIRPSTNSPYDRVTANAATTPAATAHHADRGAAASAAMAMAATVMNTASNAVAVYSRTIGQVAN